MHKHRYQSCKYTWFDMNYSLTLRWTCRKNLPYLQEKLKNIVVGFVPWCGSRSKLNGNFLDPCPILPPSFVVIYSGFFCIILHTHRNLSDFFPINPLNYLTWNKWKGSRKWLKYWICTKRSRSHDTWSKCCSVGSEIKHVLSLVAAWV